MPQPRPLPPPPPHRFQDHLGRLDAASLEAGATEHLLHLLARTVHSACAAGDAGTAGADQAPPSAAAVQASLRQGRALYETCIFCAGCGCRRTTQPAMHAEMPHTARSTTNVRRLTRYLPAPHTRARKHRHPRTRTHAHTQGCVRLAATMVSWMAQPQQLQAVLAAAPLLVCAALRDFVAAVLDLATTTCFSPG